MRSIRPYKQINKFLQSETFEPTLSWGMRMAIAAIIPVVWGTLTGNMEAASWITLTAECICWVELKGSFAQSIRVLLVGAVLAVVFAVLGSVTGGSLWLSVLCMLLVGFLAGLFKNLGERGGGLAICVYVLFIITNAFPVKDMDALTHRVYLILLGGAWTFMVGVAAVLLEPVQEPYRRTIALIWRADAALLREVSKGWDGKTLRSSVRDIYEKEKNVRSAIDASFHYYERMAHQVSDNEKEDYQLTQLRKTTALIATHITAISEELENVKVRDVSEEFRVKLYNVLRSLDESFERMATYVVLVKPEEELLLASRMTRFNKNLVLLKNYEIPEHEYYVNHLKRVIQLLERIAKLFESGIHKLQEVEDISVFKSYSLIKTLLILHPSHWLRNTRLLFDLNTFTTRYAVRSAVASAIAIFLYKWFNIDHGYWIPFTVLIVVQPYFGATLKKAIDRVIGTVAGGLVGGVLIRLPTSLYLQEIMLFVSFVAMVYFIRKKYAVAAFFITVSLVLLFDVEEDINPWLIVIRAMATIVGAALAIIAGFALLPSWDKKWLPIHLTNAIECNYQYFLATFFSDKPSSSWTRNKRSAESKNSNAFDSFNRYMQEPAIGKRPYIVFYQLITHSVRITRELNNIHLEGEGNTVPVSEMASDDQQEKINYCLQLFQKNLDEARKLNPKIKVSEIIPPQDYRSFAPSLHQMVYIEKLLYELKALHAALVDINEQGIDG